MTSSAVDPEWLSRRRHPSAAVGRLWLVGGRGDPVPSAWVHATGRLAERHLGTRFGPVARSVASRLEGAPVLGDGRWSLWSAAVVFLLADQARLFEYDTTLTPELFAAELGRPQATLTRRAAALQRALHPWVVRIPDPVDDS